MGSHSFSQEVRQLVQEKPKVSEKRTALVIGNANYITANKLANPVNDATDMAAALKEVGFTVILGTNLTRVQMREKLRLFGDALKANGGVGLFYYAGHGIQVNGANYLIPIDANIPREDEIVDSGFGLNNVFEKMVSANNGFNIVILDACRNNPFARGWSRSMATDGLAQVNAPTGTFIAYSTDVNKTADDGAGRNGLYTTELLKMIRRPNLKLEETFKEVIKAVRDASNGKQVPWTATSFFGDFYFLKTAQTDSSPAALSSNQLASSSYTNLYGRWNGMVRRREFPGILSETTQVLSTNPANAVAWRMRILASIALNDNAKVVDDANSIVRNVKAPSSEYDFDALCEANRVLERSDEAKKVCTTTIEKNPGLAYAYRNRGAMYGLAKQYDLGIADLSRAIKLEPSYEPNYLIRSYMERVVGSYDAVIYDINRLYEVSPNFVGDAPLYQRALAYMKKKEYDAAISDMDRAIVYNPKYAAHYLLRGDAHVGKGLFDKAVEDYSKVIDLNPQDPLAYSQRCYTYARQGKNDLAVADCSRAIGINTNFQPAYIYRAYAYENKGEKQLAAADRQKAGSLVNPNSIKP